LAPMSGESNKNLRIVTMTTSMLLSFSGRVSRAGASSTRGLRILSVMEMISLKKSERVQLGADATSCRVCSVGGLWPCSLSICRCPPTCEHLGRRLYPVRRLTTKLESQSVSM
jgi:hypothetical protein